MSINELVSEIQSEAVSTEKMLQNVPADKFAWKPHEKSMTLKELATHLASLSQYPGLIINTPSLDFARDTRYKPEINDTADLVAALKKGTAESIAALKQANDEDLEKMWTLRNGEHIIMEMPKGAFIRKMGMNHVYHHRGQLGVYLRLLGAKVPGAYGPSADDKLK